MSGEHYENFLENPYVNFGLEGHSKIHDKFQAIEHPVFFCQVKIYLYFRVRTRSRYRGVRKN